MRYNQATLDYVFPRSWHQLYAILAITPRYLAPRRLSVILTPLNVCNSILPVKISCDSADMACMVILGIEASNA